MARKKLLYLLPVYCMFWPMILARVLQQEQDSQESMIYSVERGIPYYCTFGTRKAVEADHMVIKICITRHRDMVYYLPDGTAMYPYLADGSPGGFILNCTADVSHGKLSEPCDHRIHRSCGITCDRGYVPVVDFLTCKVKEPLSNVSAAWSHSQPCQLQSCPANIAHGKLREQCNPVINKTCEVTCNHGYKSVVDAVTCSLNESSTDGSAVWSHSDPCEPVPLEQAGQSSVIIGIMTAVAILLFVWLIVTSIYTRCYGKGCSANRSMSNSSSKDSVNNKNNNEGEVWDPLMPPNDLDQATGQQVGEQDQATGQQVGEQDQATGQQVGEQDQATGQQVGEQDQATGQQVGEQDQATGQQVGEQDQATGQQVGEQDQATGQQVGEQDQATGQQVGEQDQATDQGALKQDQAIGRKESTTTLDSNPTDLIPASPTSPVSPKGLSDKNFTWQASALNVFTGHTVGYASYGSAGDYSLRDRAAPTMSSQGERSDLDNGAEGGGEAKWNDLSGNPPESCNTNIRKLQTSRSSDIKRLHDLMEPSLGRDSETTLQGFVTQTKEQMERLRFRDQSTFNLHWEKNVQQGKYFTAEILQNMAYVGVTIREVLQYFQPRNQEIVSHILKLHDCHLCRELFTPKQWPS